MNDKRVPFISRRQAAIQAGVDPTTVDAWVKNCLLPSVPVGRGERYKIPSAAFERFITEGAATSIKGGQSA